MSFLWFVIIGIAAGYFAGLIMKGKGFGWFVNLLLGIAGSMLGGLLIGDFFGGSLIASLVVAIVGAIILIFIVNHIKGTEK